MSILDSEDCDKLEGDADDYSCKLRNEKLHPAEVKEKCKKPELSVICVDAYSSLSRGQESMDAGSTDAFPWFLESANQFENLGETDNAIMATLKAIDYATKLNLLEKAYTFYSYGRTVYEEGKATNDPALKDPAIKQKLLKAGQSIVAKAKEIKEGSALSDMQAELKASILGGISLQKVKKDETKDLVISHGRALYEKKANEYREGADNYIKSGLVKNAVIFACMSALSELMLGNPKDGMKYLSRVASEPENKEEFHSDPCFRWTKLIFKALIKRDTEAIVQAKKLFLQIPWSYKDDKEFARRVMDSVARRLNA